MNEKHYPAGSPKGGQFAPKDKSNTDKLREGIKKYSDTPTEDMANFGLSSDKKKMTPAEKIASVHIDFDKDNILPELNESELEKVGAKTSKPVLFKKSTLYRNVDKHNDVQKEDLSNIIGEALYNPIDVFPANNKKSNYYHFAAFVEVRGKAGLKMGLVLLDIDEKKDYFEIGHVYFVGGHGFEDAKKKTIKKLV